MIPTFREAQEQVGQLLRTMGGLGAVVVDLTPLAQIERNYGGATYHSLRSRVEAMMAEMKEQVGEADILTRDEREGDRFLLFLAGRRQDEPVFSIESLKRLADRVEALLTPRVARLTMPYIRQRPLLDVGYGFVVANPMESQERQVLRLIQEALESADLRRRLSDRSDREGLLEVIYNRQLWTAFQPIVEMESATTVGHEALSRGPRGSDLELPASLFGLAASHGLVEELERACRRQAFVDWETFGAPGRLFLNTVPATVRDSSFIGRGVLDYLGPSMSPRFVTLEITERHVIENLNLYREAMHAFLEMGFTFAIDDVGAGYSGLETMATLGVSYLKIDIALVRNIHQKKVNQQVIRAILDMGAASGAIVIAEGIQTPEEVAALRQLGLRYGQGYLFARPLEPTARVARPVPT